MFLNTANKYETIRYDAITSVHSQSVARHVTSNYPFVKPKPHCLICCGFAVIYCVHVRSLRIYEYFMVVIISTIFIMILHALSHKMIFAVLDV